MRSRLLDDLLDALLPARCPGCDAPAEPVCAACASRLRPPPPVPPPAGISAWTAVFAYEGVGREIVARIKYRNARAVVPWLGRLMASAYRHRLGAERVTRVTWVPTTPARRAGRGFDHARLLAVAVAREIDRPLVDLLVRRPGPPQTGLRAPRRRVGPPLVARRAGGDGPVLLVDDVATTGGTLAAAARALRAVGTDPPVAVTAARTPRRVEAAPGAAPILRATMHTARRDALLHVTPERSR